MSLKPARAGRGIRFRRADLGGIEIPATVDNVDRLHYATALSRDAGTVETVLPGLGIAGAQHILVDPPRAGLHPTAAGFLAQLQAHTLVYVACNPASLGRDREVLEEGGWKLDGLWTVDLFPQTPHVEAVGRFTRPSEEV